MYQKPVETERRSSRSLNVFMGVLMTAVGAGMLSVPSTFTSISVWQGVVAIFGVGVSMGLTAQALLYAHVQVATREEIRSHIGAGIRFASFEALAVKAGGANWGLVVSLVIAFGIFGSAVGSLRVVCDLTPHVASLLSKTLAEHELKNSEQSEWSHLLLWVCIGAILLPLSLLKDVSKLKFTNYVGFCCSLFIVFMVIYQASTTPLYLGDNQSHTVNTTDHALGDGSAGVSHVGMIGHRTLENAPASASGDGSWTQLAQSISVYNFVFMMQQNLLPLFILQRGNFEHSLQQSQDCMVAYISAVMAFCILLYTSFGLFAFKLYGHSIYGNVLLNLKQDSVMQLPVLAVYLTVIMTFPMVFQPMRSAIQDLMDRRYPVKRCDDSKMKHIVITVGLLAVVEITALCVPGVETVFALVGAMSCLGICFVFPVMLFTRLYPWRDVRGGSIWVAALWTIVAFQTIVSCLAIVNLLM